MQENSRHVRAFVHQRPDETYQNSVDKVKEASQRMQQAQQAVNAHVQEVNRKVNDLKNEK